jgi:ferrous iron transport protein B
MEKFGIQPVSIITLHDEEEGIIHRISGGKAITSRLAGMGIVPNVRVKVLRSSAGPILIQVANTRVALGEGEASKIFVYRVEAEETEQKAPDCKTILVALAGQPNVGKSTVFNILTGLSQHVGNWPGKTVEKKEGAHVCEDLELRIVDLPGTYSLTAFSEEERVARDFIIGTNPDVTVLIVNTAALERSLYLLSELLLLGPPVIVALNMIDVAEAQGVRVDVQALQKVLGVPVVPMVATKNRGLRELVDQLVLLSRGKLEYCPYLPDVAADHRTVFITLMELIADYVRTPYTVRWTAVKLMEGDPEVSTMMESRLPDPIWNEVRQILIRHEDSLHAVVGGRYDWIEEITRASVSTFKRGQVLMTDRIDHVLTRPIFGIPILIGILALVFTLTYKVGLPLQEILEKFIRTGVQKLEPYLVSTPEWFKGLLIDGIIGGTGLVLTFIPILIIFFIVMAFLENVGYMARAAFVMDRFMHIVGLHGKSFLPMCLGFGCNVPAILGARIVDSRKERLLTMFLTPFVPCAARLAVLAFIAAALFADRAALISWTLLTLNILILGMVGMVLTKVLLKDEPTPFIMELPLYHKPDPRVVAIVVKTRTVAFLKNAGTIILMVSIIVWFLSYFPDGRIEHSFLGKVGRIIEPIGTPLGLDWKMIVALLTSFAAKENAIATLGVLYGVGEDGLMNVLPHVIDQASGIAFLVVLMLFIPCAATAAVMRREMGNRTWFVSSLLTMSVLSYLGGIIAYHIALMIGW